MAARRIPYGSLLVALIAISWCLPVLTKTANQLLREADALGNDKEDVKVSLLKEALSLDPSNVDAAKSLSFLRISQLFRVRTPDDPQHPLLTEAVEVLDGVRTRTRLTQDMRNMVCNSLVHSGQNLEGRDRPLMAVELYLLSSRIDPSHENTIGSLYKIREWLCVWEGREKEFSGLMKIVMRQLGQGEAVQTSLQPLTAISQDVDLRTQLSIAKAWSLLYSSGQRRENPFLGALKPPSAKKILSVGYISGDLRGHAVSHQMLTIFRQHMVNARIRVVVFNTFSGNVGAHGQEIKTYVNKWVDVHQMRDEQLAASITNSLKIHVLIDLSGHTGGTRLSALSLRPSPVIVSFLGYGSTTGASFVDYFVSDLKASPPEMSFAHSETFAYLPPTYYPFNTRQDIDPRPSYEDAVIARDQTDFIFACFNRNLKIKPDIFEVWMRILKAVPRSVLWLRRFHIRVQENLLKHAERMGVSNSSIIFAGRIPQRSKHLARHQLADLFLDTPRFGGHSTLADVYWAGVPALVIPGEGVSSRIGASMASAFNGSVFIARNLQDYHEMAVQLASKRGERTIEMWKKQEAPTIHDDGGRVGSQQYTMGLERMYQSMWEEFRTRRHHKQRTGRTSRPFVLSIAAHQPQR